MSAPTMQLTIEIEREADGRFVAEVPELPGVLAYGATEDEADRAVRVLALRVIADRFEHREALPPSVSQVFPAA